MHASGVVDVCIFKGFIKNLPYNVISVLAGNRRRIIDIPPEKDGFPDGMCMDEEGMLWVAHYSGSSIHKYNPTIGKTNM